MESAVGCSGPITLRLQALFFFLLSLYHIQLAGAVTARAIPGSPNVPVAPVEHNGTPVLVGAEAKR